MTMELPSPGTSARNVILGLSARWLASTRRRLPRSRDSFRTMPTGTAVSRLPSTLRHGESCGLRHEVDYPLAERHQESRLWDFHDGGSPRSEEHTSELQSLMRISYAVFCLTNKK